jgi:hypothetical protein
LQFLHYFFCAWQALEGSMPRPAAFATVNDGMVGDFQDKSGRTGYAATTEAREQASVGPVRRFQTSG